MGVPSDNPVWALVTGIGFPGSGAVGVGRRGCAVLAFLAWGRAVFPISSGGLFSFEVGLLRLGVLPPFGGGCLRWVVCGERFLCGVRRSVAAVRVEVHNAPPSSPAGEVAAYW